jgi:phage terminase small subunit
MGRRGPKSLNELLARPPLRRTTAAERRKLRRDLPPPPEHLRPETQQWWTAIASQFDFEPHQLRTLQCAAESWDRKEQAREALGKHGLVYTDAKGMVRARPEAAIERDGRTAYLRAMRELALDHVDPPRRDPGGFGITWEQLQDPER